MKKAFIIIIIFWWSSFSYATNKENVNIDSLLNYADSVKSKGNYILSLKSLDRARVSAIDQKDSVRIYWINQRLGNLFYEWDNYEKSYYYYKEAQKIASFLNNDPLKAGAYNNLGNIFSSQKLWDSSLVYYKRAHYIYSLQKDTLSIAGTNNNIGTIYNYQEKYSKSIPYYKMAYLLMLKKGRTDDAAIFTLNISAAYASLNQKDSALFYIKKAEVLSKDQNNMRLNMRIANTYAKLFEIFGEYKMAMIYLNAYYQMSDSIYNLQKHEQIVEWQEKYESEKQKNTIALLQKQKEIGDVNLRKQNIIIYAITFVAFLILINLLMIIRQHKLKTKILKSEQLSLNDQKEKLLADKKLQEAENQLLTDRIHHKERELVSSTMHLLQKNELIKKLKVTLDNINENLDDESLSNFSMDMKGLSTQSGMWDSFNYHFEQVHPHFFVSLKKQFPELTQNDLKIASFIKIGLNNKEIGSLMQIAPESVKSAKKRFKKKIDLKADDDLTAFIITNASTAPHQ